MSQADSDLTPGELLKEFDAFEENREDSQQLQVEPENYRDDKQPIESLEEWKKERVTPLELKLFKQYQLYDDALIFRTSAKSGESGFYLALVIAKSLELSGKLSRVELSEEDQQWDSYHVQMSEGKLPYCAINDYIIGEYNEEILHQLYDSLNGRYITDQDLLNLWMRAWSPNNEGLFDMIQSSYSLPVLASIVERGGNPLAAIRL